MERAVAAAASAEVAVVIVGSNSDGESEGFDRDDLDLPGDQVELVERVAAANANTVIIINAGAPIAMPWVGTVRANMMLWFPGEEGAEALVDHLLGHTGPSGRCGQEGDRPGPRPPLRPGTRASCWRARCPPMAWRWERRH